MDWTSEQVLALAPDPASAKSGRDLAHRRKWVSAGRSDAALWGECQGSGASAYQTAIDLAEPAFKCSCPSRKFPCKHGIGLFLLAVIAPGDVPAGQEPEWVVSWLTSRSARAKQATALPLIGSDQPEKQAMPAKSVAAREAKIAAGIDDLNLWLRDIMRGGIAELPSKPSSYFGDRASRLIDSQAPGLARRVTEIGQAAGIGSGWQERTLERIGLLYLLIEGYRQQETLPEATRADVRTMTGWTQNQEDALAGEAVPDAWIVAGTRTFEENHLNVQREWLMGLQSGRAALILNYAHRSQPVKSMLQTGTIFAAEADYFPGAAPLRALLQDRTALPDAPLIAMPFGSIEAAKDRYRQSLTANPWLEQYPAGLQAVVPVKDAEWWHLIEPESGDSMPVAARLDSKLMWRLVSLCGGNPSAIFGEWDGRELRPLSVWHEGGLVQVEH